MKIENCKLKIVLALLLFFVLCCLFLNEAKAQSSLKSDNYEITLPNLNMVSGNAASPGYKMGVTGGQTAPGLYTSAGYKIKAGFQYIHSIIPFSFQISTQTLAFGTLNPEVLTNNQSLTLTVNSGSAGGYQVKVQENDPLTSTTGSTIPDTICDTADTCTHTDAGTWTQTTTYGFGYNMTGTDIPSEFSGSKYKNFPDNPAESPVKIMGKTPAEGHQAGKNKIATLNARINISNIQAAGVYQNILSFTALPTY